MDAADTRARLIDAAIALFGRHSFAGTSLQMIADELGLTKAAIYYHFRSREQLLTGVVEPIFRQLETVVDAAETLRSVSARADAMLCGYAEMAVRHRALVSVLGGDPSVIRQLSAQPGWAELIERQMRLLADVEPGPGGLVKAAVVVGGIAGAVGPGWITIDDDDLLGHLVETGRRTLGLRAPRRSPATDFTKGTK
ncbi:TetR/AcrR family transcriptional regulator [Mycolicibacterium frederiksbergense]|uniref:TetR/AcrR family transcriptional regulator n=1 Tax=Mycolicibacterium frederiksbergense TaxID=117567 RepID=A0A6H0S653_9MYCO|nr:TetR/AcrR family transcriptional regulator [Mycolicibacterium frederiksbergense]QIV81517.1 TetR/AcrR family transcriptional regulator [Mycolicibacterium frederiksbergense]